MMSNAVVVLESCHICSLPNVASINKDLIQGRRTASVVKRNGISEELSNFNKTELHSFVMNHFKDHITSPIQALANHLTMEKAVEMKNLIVETSSDIDAIDVFKVQVLDRLETVKSDSDFAKIAKVYDSLFRRKDEKINTLHKISPQKEIDDVKKVMLTSFYQTVSKHLGQEEVAKMKQDARKRNKKKNRAEYVADAEVVEDGKEE